MASLYINGIPKESSNKIIEANIREVFLKATNDLKWLKKGDLVLLKPALNSPDPYPSTTHPLSVKVVAEEIEKRGGKVIIGDQSGMEHVVDSPNGVVKGDSHKNYEAAGMGRGVKQEFQAFEKEDWASWKHFTKAKHWPQGFYYTKWIDEADHIISLPRVSTHAMAGVTLGFKNLVGILRTDSRFIFHKEGPFNNFLAAYGKDAGIEVPTPKHNKFFERMTEIFLCIQKKHRCTLFTATKAQVTFGPDAYTMHAGPLKMFKAHVVEPDTGCVFASQDPVAAEVFAVALLMMLYEQATPGAKAMNKILLSLNKEIAELGSYSPWENQFVKYALKLGLGKRETPREYSGLPAEMQAHLENLLTTAISAKSQKS